MISEHDRIFALTKIAALNALILSLLVLQLLFPLLLVPFLCLLPTFFAIQIFSAHLADSGLSALAIALTTTLFFGFDLAVWVIVYLCIGVALAVSHKVFVWLWPQLLSITLTYGLLLFTMFSVANRLAQIEWDTWFRMMAQLGLWQLTPEMISGIGFLTVSGLMSAFSFYFFRNIMEQIGLA